MKNLLSSGPCRQVWLRRGLYSILNWLYPMFFLCHSPVFMLLCCSVFWQGHLSFVVPFRNTCIKLLWSCDMFPWQKSSWASLLKPLCRSGVSTVSLPFYPFFFFFVLTKSKPAGCCVLAGHVLILGQGWPCVFILPDRMVLFFSFWTDLCL